MKKSLDELARRDSQRLDHIKYPSVGKGKDSIIDREDPVTKKPHEVSLKNIVFEGSNRKLSVLHPSYKGTDQIPSGMVIPQN